MDRLATYALVAAIGEITKPTREERNREGDRWVALRSLDREPVSLADTPAAPPPPTPARRPVFVTAIDRRHAEVRRRLGL